MERSANRKRRATDIRVGDKAWLSTEHLRLPPGLTRKFAPRFVGPFDVLAAVSHVSFRLALPDGWRIHPVFYTS